MWESLLGTPYLSSYNEHFLFFEEIAETMNRVDRIVQHIRLSGCLGGVRAILLGDFMGCEDRVPMVLARPLGRSNPRRVLQNPRSSELKPLRRSYSQIRFLKEIFGNLGEELGIPVAYGLPVGHGPNFQSLPLGANYQLTGDGKLKLLRWSWLDG